jgi:hypothetical protein
MPTHRRDGSFLRCAQNPRIERHSRRVNLANCAPRRPQARWRRAQRGNASRSEALASRSPSRRTIGSMGTPGSSARPCDKKSLVWSARTDREGGPRVASTPARPTSRGRSGCSCQGEGRPGPRRRRGPLLRTSIISSVFGSVARCHGQQVRALRGGASSPAYARGPAGATRDGGPLAVRPGERTARAYAIEAGKLPPRGVT